MAWLFVPALEDSNKDSTLPLMMPTELSLAWNGKPLLPSSWSRVCRRAPYLRSLSGLTSEPSTVQRGVESWISSLRASRASLTPSLESGKGLRTSATSGRTCSGSSESASQLGFFSKTCRGLSPTSSTSLCPDCRIWATTLRRFSLRQRTLGRRTDANGSSYWPTAQALSRGKAENNAPDNSPLHREAVNWPTPQAHDTQERGNTEADHHYRPHDLSNAAALWPSPTAHDGRRPGSDDTSTQGANLKRDAELWQTPATDSPDAASGDEQAPNKGARMWATPRMEGFDAGRHRGNADSLHSQSKDWRTPNSRDWSAESWRERETGDLTPTLADQVLSHPGLTTPKDGSESSESGQTSRRRSVSTKSGMSDSDTRLLRRRLNPRFVEWLMGWPIGWTSLAPLGSDSAGMASCLSKQPTPSVSCGSGSE